MVYLQGMTRRGGGLLALLALLTLLLSAAPSWGASYFVYQQWGGTWQDANKTAANTEDDLMCWAAAASNVLTWGSWGTSTYNTTDKVFKHFQDHWTDNVGYPSYAWRWWFNGATPTTTLYSYVDVPGGGNFFPAETFSNYYRSVYSSYIPFSLSLMQQGFGVSLFISNGSTYRHAVTAWGFDYDIVDGAKIYRNIYITDSDDSFLGLKKYALNLKGSYYYLSDAYASWYVSGLQALKRRSIASINGGLFLEPETSLPGGVRVVPTPLPATALLLASGVILILCGRRRRI